jgi:hypothetical protein
MKRIRKLDTPLECTFPFVLVTEDVKIPSPSTGVYENRLKDNSAASFISFNRRLKSKDLLSCNLFINACFSSKYIWTSFTEQSPSGANSISATQGFSDLLQHLQFQ